MTTARSEATEQVREAPEPRSRRRSGVGPMLFLIALTVVGGGFLLFYFLEHEPARRGLADARREARTEQRARGASERRAIAAERERDQLRAQLAELRSAEEGLRGERDQLAQERDQLRAQTEQTAATLAAMQEAQNTLRERLREELASGDAQMRDDGDAVTVELGERILFPAGEAELNERGRAVLERLATSLATLEDREIRVEGHTDATPLSGENAERFPTNWELSASRATSVVRFFEAHGIDGERLAAVGYGPNHPVASNSSARGRARNRRIELVLVRRTGR
jgi:chemotaxis protein MotB